MADGQLSTSMRWSTVSVIGREVTRTLFTIVLARLIGPEDFGIVAQALVYIGIVSLLIDQGFSSALIQRERLDDGLAGAVVTVNLAVGAALTAITIGIAPLWAEFMRTPELLVVLIAFAPSLVIRSAAVTPRALLIRSLDFRPIAVADVSSALVGGIAGVAVAVAGGGYWSLVVQILVTDVVLILVFLIQGAGLRPNVRLRLLRSIAGFSSRAFLAGLLINSVSRNIDNLLVGRFQGAEALAFYGLAYRLLLMPVQLALTTVATVLFPTFSRLAQDAKALSDEVARATRAVAALALPGMAVVAAAAPQLVLVVFGADWNPAIPIIQVLALAGALQAIYQSTTTPLVLGLGRDKLNLRFAWVTTIVTAVGVVAGLPFGPFGVAVGYTTATALLVPVEWMIRRHLVGTTLRDQVTPLIPAIHSGLWGAGAYLAIALAVPGHELIVLLIGLLTAVTVVIGVLRLVHRSVFEELVAMGRSMLDRGSGGSESSDTIAELESSGTTDERSR